MNISTKSSTNVELEIVHAVKGRVRLRLKSGDARELFPRIAHYLQQQAGIDAVQIKQTSSSLVITFDPDTISVEQLTDSLQSFGAIATPIKVIAKSTGESHPINYGRFFALVPPLVGLGVARSLQVSGWKSILTYILAAGVTREVIDRVTEESEVLELSPEKSVSTTEIAAAEILPLLTAIETDYEIVHQIPGRIRLRIPRISRDYASRLPWNGDTGKADRNYAQELKHLLEQDSRVIDVRFKTNSSSVVILYNPEALSDSNQEQVALNDSNGKVDESESSTILDRQETVTNSNLNDTPPLGDETSVESNSLPSETETNTGDTSDT